MFFIPMSHKLRGILLSQKKTKNIARQNQDKCRPIIGVIPQYPFQEDPYPMYLFPLHSLITSSLTRVGGSSHT